MSASRFIILIFILALISTFNAKRTMTAKGLRLSGKVQAVAEQCLAAKVQLPLGVLESTEARFCFQM